MRIVWRAFQHNVSVGAGDAESADAADAAGAGPRRRLARDLVACAGPVDGRIEFATIEARGDLPVMQRKRHLDEARDPGRDELRPDCMS